MYKRISKRKIKKYIDFLKLKLQELEEKGKFMQEENEASGHLIYDLTDHYLNEERVRGSIKAANYILHNC